MQRVLRHTLECVFVCGIQSSSVLGFTIPLCGLIHDAVQKGRRKGAENIKTYVNKIVSHER